MKKLFLAVICITALAVVLSVPAMAEAPRISAATGENWGYDDSTISGDVNGDYSVDILDLVRMKKYLAGEQVKIIEQNSDLNGDFAISAPDLRDLRQLLLQA